MFNKKISSNIYVRVKSHYPFLQFTYTSCDVMRMSA